MDLIVSTPPNSYDKVLIPGFQNITILRDKVLKW